MTSLEQLCKDLEHFETPEWAARAVLKHEILTKDVFDPCCGAGVLSRAAEAAGYSVVALDIHDWGYDGQVFTADFLQESSDLDGVSVFMNPPFSKAEAFVEKAVELGARKILCFQRFAWWESDGRKEFWQNYQPNRIYLCASRATCWRHDLPKDERGNRFDPKTGKKLAGTSTAHAWFVWEKDHPPGTLVGHIYRGDHRETGGN
jgi:predicted RNA methylase